MAGSVLIAAAFGAAGCSGGGSDTPPAVSGVSPDSVEAELIGLDCVVTRDILSTVSKDDYFGTAAGLAAGGTGGTASEWRAVLEWWWQTECGGQ